MSGPYEKLEKLKEDKKKLEDKVRAIENDLRRGLDKSRHEQAAELENYEVLLEILRVSEDELNELNKQIYQLESANY